MLLWFFLPYCEILLQSTFLIGQCYYIIRKWTFLLGSVNCSEKNSGDILFRLFLCCCLTISFSLACSYVWDTTLSNGWALRLPFLIYSLNYSDFLLFWHICCHQILLSITFVTPQVSHPLQGCVIFFYCVATYCVFIIRVIYLICVRYIFLLEDASYSCDFVPFWKLAAIYQICDFVFLSVYTYYVTST